MILAFCTLKTKSHWLLINQNITVTVLFTELSYSYFSMHIYEYKIATALYSQKIVFTLRMAAVFFPPRLTCFHATYLGRCKFLQSVPF